MHVRKDLPQRQSPMVVGLVMVYASITPAGMQAMRWKHLTMRNPRHDSEGCDDFIPSVGIPTIPLQMEQLYLNEALERVRHARYDNRHRQKHGSKTGIHE